MSSGIVVVDYGSEMCFPYATPCVRSVPKPKVDWRPQYHSLRRSRHLARCRRVCPCDGSFESRGISDALRDFVASGRPFLGICIGMQVLMQRSTNSA